jgi:hypothetical protein
MQSTKLSDSEGTRRFGISTVLLAALMGGTMACLTLSVLGAGYPSEIPFIGDPRRTLVTLLFPGMLGSALISGNAHAWHLWVAALVNGITYFGIGWIGCRVAAIIIRMARKIVG